MNMTEVGKSGEMKNGTMKEISVDGRKILLARVDDQYYATDNRCPHKPLVAGSNPAAATLLFLQ